MRFDCDLSWGLARRQSLKFRALEGAINKRWVKPEFAMELSVLMSTPGFRPGYFVQVFQWSGFGLERAKFFMREYPADPDHVRLNLATVDANDGENFLRVLLDVRPDWGDHVPWWTSLMLAERREAGATAAQLAREFGTTTDRIRRWWQVDRTFDPLSGDSVPTS